MKKIFLMLMLSPSVGLGQEGFHIGMFANNGLFWLYNKNDFQSDKSKIETISPSAFQFYNNKYGIAFGSNINMHSILNLKLSYSNNRQDYRIKMGPDNYFNLVSKLNYFEIITNYEFHFSDFQDKEIIPYLNGGLNLSFLNNFHDYGSQILNNRSSYISNHNGIIHNYSTENSIVSSEFEAKSDFIYNRITFGLNAEAGIRLHLSDYIQLSIELIGQYSLINTDNLKANIYSNDTLLRKNWDGDLKFWNGNPEAIRKPSHNIYEGLGITINYFFRSRYDY